MIRTLSCERTRIHDEANNYLWTHWDFTVEVHWHPAVAAYTRPANVFEPVATPGTQPGETDLALLTRLLQPRGLLRVTAGGSVVLETPGLLRGVRLPCDVKGGPSVEAVNAPVMIGVKHWIITLHVVADVRDIDPYPQSTSVVISNLWVGTEDISENRRSIRQFAGRAILRADIMRSQGVNANSFRDLYLFPCPQHYQRQNVRVQLSEDGTVCDWSFEDEMRGYDLGINSPITHIECFRTGYVKKGSPARGLTTTVRNSLASPIQTATSGAPALASRVFADQMDNLPKYYMQCRCDLIGDRNADLGFLASIALGVCINQLSIAGINGALTGLTEIIFRQDIADDVFTSVEMTQTMSDDALAVAGVASDPIAAFRGIVADNDATVTALGRAGSAAMVNKFRKDSTQLLAGYPAQLRPITPPPPGSDDVRRALRANGIVADRSGDLLFKDNPPLRQGAFGVVPASQVPANNVLGTVPGAAGAAPSPDAAIGGNIPSGIEHLIVQALLGQGVTPPRPDTLTTDS